jgi:cell division transport system ATP-binding protein
MSIHHQNIIRMFHVCKRYGTQHALTDITLDIRKNELIFISGASGAGKSTLLKLLYLGERTSEGQILVDGMNLSRLSSRRVHLLRRKTGIIFQDFKLITSKTVFENVALVLEARGLNPRLIRKKVLQVLKTSGMEHKGSAYPPSLSGGEQQRVAVARAVVGDPQIILADEPTGNLDAASARLVMNLLNIFRLRGATIIIATHNQALIRNQKARHLHIEQGRLISDTGRL